MNDRYLWDREGPADPDVEQLERKLAPLAWSTEDAPALAFPDASVATGEAGAERTAESVAEVTPPRSFTRGPIVARPFRWVASLAAGLLALLALAVFDRTEPSSGYRARGLAGREVVHVGDELSVTAGTATLEIGDLGEVTLETGSRFSVESANDQLHRLRLSEGRMQARIWAPPELFQVDTPAGLTIDLGCEYRLDVDPEGVSTLIVDSGQVAFQLDGREVFVPAGASCVSRPGRGPGAPVFEDAALPFRAAVERAEFAQNPAPADLAEIAGIDRREDALTLFHLLDAPSVALRDCAFARLSDLFPKPRTATDADLRSAGSELRAEWMEEMKPHWR